MSEPLEYVLSPADEKFMEAIEPYAMKQILRMALENAYLRGILFGRQEKTKEYSDAV